MIDRWSRYESGDITTVNNILATFNSEITKQKPFVISNKFPI